MTLRSTTRPEENVSHTRTLAPGQDNAVSYSTDTGPGACAPPTAHARFHTVHSAHHACVLRTMRTRVTNAPRTLRTRHSLPMHTTLTTQTRMRTTHLAVGREKRSVDLKDEFPHRVAQLRRCNNRRNSVHNNTARWPRSIYQPEEAEVFRFWSPIGWYSCEEQATNRAECSNAEVHQNGEIVSLPPKSTLSVEEKTPPPTHGLPLVKSWIHQTC